MRKSLNILLIAAVALMACSRVPDGVIPPGEMAELMADVRMADAVVTVHGADYRPDAAKLALKEAVFRKHGVTSEQFDTSLVWYGHHMDRYQDVNDRTIEILEKRMRRASVLAAGEAALSVSGDSVDMWTGRQAFAVTSKSPSQYLTFGFDADVNSEPGDIYTLRTRIVVPPENASWNITAVYNDSAVETISGTLSNVDPHRQEITLYTDSTRALNRVSGWLRIVPSGHRPSIVDSVSLTRRRVAPAAPGSKSYNQRLYEPSVRPAPADTVSAAS